jgi:hypothetical protein
MEAIPSTVDTLTGLKDGVGEKGSIVDALM